MHMGENAHRHVYLVSIHICIWSWHMAKNTQAISNIHLLLNWLCRQFMTSLRYLQKLFSWSIWFAQF